MKNYRFLTALVAVASLLAPTASVAAADAVGYTDTPMLPGGKWHVHDPDRPQPRVVTPGTPSTKKKPGKAPSDAIVLFDGTDLSKWRDAKGNPSGWKLEEGAMIVPPEGTEGGGDIFTKEEFGDCQLHVEFATPDPPKGDSQGRGNSGVFLLGRYEFQVLDSYNNRTYADGSAGSLYGQYPPLVNASKKPGEWQVYDIVFTAPRYKDGKLETPAYVTAFHNGVLVQNHAAYLGPSGHKTLANENKPGPTVGPLKLQDHHNPMHYRNIWIRPLKGYDE
ncbi:MAG TPA: DUF1080 domain-containing protein [Verrucomicrobiae bacterium]|nr:DUF1080 domain-containing protein [Verrucomicrobiae bacterium]